MEAGLRERSDKDVANRQSNTGTWHTNTSAACYPHATVTPGACGRLSRYPDHNVAVDLFVPSSAKEQISISPNAKVL